jgi:hypothetical protein
MISASPGEYSLPFTSTSTPRAVGNPKELFGIQRISAEAGGIIDEDNRNVAAVHEFQHVLERQSSTGVRARYAEVAIDDVDPGIGPSPLASALGQLTLDVGRAGVVPDLLHRGLSDVHEGGFRQVLRLDLRRSLHVVSPPQSSD